MLLTLYLYGILASAFVIAITGAVGACLQLDPKLAKNAVVMVAFQLLWPITFLPSLATTLATW